MESKQCAGCGKSFHPRPQRPDQRFCAQPNCQRARKRQWQQQRRQRDPDYRENEARSGRLWRQCHPDYWRAYRQAHPDYQARNRLQQSERDRLQWGRTLPVQHPFIPSFEGCQN